MVESILTSTKKILGLSADYDVFDVDVITHINSTLAIANQLGVGPDPTIFVEDESTEWSELGLPANQLNLLRTYLFLKVKMVFDPPTSGFLIDAATKQISEYESRLMYFADNAPPVVNTVDNDDEIEEGALYGSG